MTDGPDFIATVNREEWLAAYDKLKPFMDRERFTVHFGGSVLRPPSAGPKWKPEGYTVWVGEKYATAKTLGVAIDRAVRAYGGNDAE
jgi:hypothetical protein